jgi:Uncharacterized protein conserved in bacteria (DUF2334)
VPRWHGNQIAEHPLSIDHARASYGELLLHGYTHQASSARGPIALLTNGANEFSALRHEDARFRVRHGQADLTRCFGAGASGFVPPAWQAGSLTSALLAESGIVYQLGLRELRTATGGRQPLAVWSWDCGRVAALGLAGECLGALMRAILRGATPCVVLHPADLARGFLGRAIDLVRRLLAEGLQPVLPCELARAVDARGCP